MGTQATLRSLISLINSLRVFHNGSPFFACNILLTYPLRQCKLNTGGYMRQLVSSLIIALFFLPSLGSPFSTPPKDPCEGQMASLPGIPLEPVFLNKRLYYTYEDGVDITAALNAMETINKFVGYDYLHLFHHSDLVTSTQAHIKFGRIEPNQQAVNSISHTKSGTLVSSTIILSDTMNLSTIDMESLFLHEFLHSLGLGHIEVVDDNEVMNWRMARQQVRRKLTPKAKQTLQCIYLKGKHK